MDESISQFVAVTGASSEEAHHFLEATGNELEPAIQLFFDGGAAAFDTNGQNPTVGAFPSLDEQSEALARQLQEESAVAPVEASAGQDDVRRPDVVVRERLYDAPRPDMHMAAVGNGYSFGASFSGSRHAPPQVSMPFRNFRMEGDEDLDEAPGLGEIYRPPFDLITDQTMAELKSVAEKDDKWMLINVQSMDEFASLQLNADVWGQSMIKDIVRGNFVFAQRSMPNNEAQQLASTYHLETLPAIMILDPHTAQKMVQWDGLVSVDRFLEDLMPFLEMPPSDPKAGALLSASLKQTTFQSLAPPVRGAAGISGVSDDDESLAKAIEASLVTPAGALFPDNELNGSILAPEAPGERAAGFSGLVDAADASAPGALESSVDLTLPDADAITAEPPGVRLQHEAAARVPVEPAAGTAGTCRIAIRLPDNRRVVRHFMISDTVQVLYDFVLTLLSPEDASNPFVLADPMPGGTQVTDCSLSLEAAKVAGCMLLCKWI